jgi:hypothetical protein
MNNEQSRTRNTIEMRIHQEEREDMSNICWGEETYGMTKEGERSRTISERG